MGGLRGHPQVHGAMARHDAGLVVEGGVDLRKFAHRQHHGAHQQRQQRQAPALGAPLLVQRRAQGLDFGDVDFLDIAEVRDAALRFLHLHGDAAAQADDGNRLRVVPFGAEGRGARCGDDGG